MNKMGKLIKAKTISFVDTLIKNYNRMNLNEQETIILLLLYYQQEETNQQLLIKNLINATSLDENQLSTVILNLVKKGFIELIIEDGGKELFSIDQVYDALGTLLDTENDETSDLIRKENLNAIVMYVETTYQRNVNTGDLIIINGWLDLHYTIEEIKEAILDSLKAKKMHLKYADAILASRNKKKEEVEADSEMASILDGIYVKKR